MVAGLRFPQPDPDTAGAIESRLLSHVARTPARLKKPRRPASRLGPDETDARLARVLAAVFAPHLLRGLFTGH